MPIEIAAFGWHATIFLGWASLAAVVVSVCAVVITKGLIVKALAAKAR